MQEFLKIFLLKTRFVSKLAQRTLCGKRFVGDTKTPNPTRVAATESLQHFGAEVRELRKARQMTLAALAEASGVSVSHLSAIERGSVNPTLSKILKIADGLGVPEEWFFNTREGEGPLERLYVVRHQNRNAELVHRTFPDTQAHTGLAVSYLVAQSGR